MRAFERYKLALSYCHASTCFSQDRLKQTTIIKEVRARDSDEFPDNHSDKNLSAFWGTPQTGVVQTNREELDAEVIADDFSDEHDGIFKEVDCNPYECQAEKWSNAESENETQTSHNDDR